MRGSKKLSKQDYSIIKSVDSLHCTRWIECDMYIAQAESDYAKQYINRRKERLKELSNK